MTYSRRLEGLEEKRPGPARKIGRLLGKLGDMALSFMLAFCKIFPIIAGGLIVVAFACSIYGLQRDRDQMRADGWTEMDVPSRRSVEAEMLARERARNEFGDATGKYAFHCRNAGGLFWYKAHAATNTCGECAK